MPRKVNRRHRLLILIMVNHLLLRNLSNVPDARSKGLPRQPRTQPTTTLTPSQISNFNIPTTHTEPDSMLEIDRGRAARTSGHANRCAVIDYGPTRVRRFRCVISCARVDVTLCIDDAESEYLGLTLLHCSSLLLSLPNAKDIRDPHDTPKEVVRARPAARRIPRHLEPKDPIEKTEADDQSTHPEMNMRCD